MSQKNGSDHGRIISDSIFDYDGVLLHYWPRAWEAIANILDYLGLLAIQKDLNKEEYRNLLQRVSIGRALLTIIPIACKKHGLLPPTEKAIIEALIYHEMKCEQPIALTAESKQALHSLYKLRQNHRHNLQLIAILSNRSYKTASFHMEGAHPILFSLVDAMQFKRNRGKKRRKEQKVADAKQYPCSVMIQKHSKPDPRAFMHFARWMHNNNYMNGFSRRNTFISFYIGDTVSDAEGVENANSLFREKNIPLRFLFVPACIGGTILNNEEWEKAIGKPAWATCPIYAIKDVENLMNDYNNGVLTIPDLR